MANTYTPTEEFFNTRDRLRRTPPWGRGGEIQVIEVHAGHFFNAVVSKFPFDVNENSMNVYTTKL